ncbi:hypothetical protein I4U23_008158 [Adineta vaga]|nr:hypothetical protein I4U23_008158 [Adineta vaga]
MSQRYLFFICMIYTFLFLAVQMYRINNDFDEFQRYQRGFGNRRSLSMHHLRHHHPKDILYTFDNQDDKYLFVNPSETNEQNDLTSQQQQQQSSILYH